jgi:hypothetical protein
MKTIISTIFIIFTMGCVENTISPKDNSVPLIYEQAIEADIVSHSFNGSSVDVQYTIKNKGSLTINKSLVWINIMAVNKNYIYDNELSLIININETITNNISINTEGNNYTNLEYAIISVNKIK